MAVPPNLNPAARRRLLAVVAVVLLAHVFILEGLSRWTTDLRLLKPMVAPMYTRLLEPAAPPPVAPPAEVAQAAPTRPTAQIRPAPSVPKRNTPTLPQKQEARPEPAQANAGPDLPEPPVLAEEPVPAPEPSPEPPPEAPPTAVADAPQLPASEAIAAARPAPSANASGTATATLSPSAPTLGADGWPADTRLRYRLGGKFRSGDLYGNARVLWQREGARYQVRVEVELTFLATLVMTSQGQVGAGTLMPEVYEEVRNGKPRGLRMTERDVLLANGKVVRRPPGVQDTASQFVELSHRFASGRDRLAVGNAVSLWMARPGQVDLWTYDVVASEVLRTAIGDVEAFHLKPRPIANPRGNITAEMWFAPSLQYLPVRIRVNMGEEAHIDLLVEAIEQR